MTNVMRIAIDARTAGTRLDGSTTFIENTVEALSKVDPSNLYTIYVSSREGAERFDKRWDNFSVRFIGDGSSFLDRVLGFNSQLRLHPVDVFFAQFFVPKFCPTRSVAMIADLSFEHTPATIASKDLEKMRASIRRSALSASQLIAPSEYTKRDLVATYGIDPQKITVIYHAASPNFMPLDNTVRDSVLRSKYGLSGDFILSVGTIQPRKNLPRLIEAYARNANADPEFPPLVLVGQEGWLTDESMNAASRFNVKDRVMFTGYVPDNDLPLLYSMATMFVYPSFFEGFGLPPLEAMQCGTPVITGNRTSLPEVVGDAGLLVDPFDINALAEAMEKLLSDVDLRKSLSEKGIARAKKFSWVEAARQTLEVFEKVCAK